MTDLASQKSLTRAAPHLPLAWYFDPRIAALEDRADRLSLNGCGSGIADAVDRIEHRRREREVSERTNHECWSLSVSAMACPGPRAARAE